MPIPFDPSALPSPISKPLESDTPKVTPIPTPLTNKITETAGRVLPTVAPPQLQGSSAKGRSAQAKIPPSAVIAQELENIKKTQGEEQARAVQTVINGTKTPRLPPPSTMKMSQLIEGFARQGRALPAPAAFSHLAPDEDVAIMWRGCGAARLVKMVNHQSAGGIPFNQETQPPTEEEAKRQVGESLSLPEFTTNPAIAEQFGKGNVVGVFAIPKRYLKEGSGSERGWIASKETPVVLLAWKEGAPLVPTFSSSHSAVRINQSLSTRKIQRSDP